MAQALSELPIFPPTIGNVDRIRRTLQLAPPAEVLALFQHEQLGALALVREDPAQPRQPRTFSAIRVGVTLDVDEQNGHYRGTIFGLYREILQPPPAEGEPPPPPIIRRDVWHVIELLTNPPEHPQLLPVIPEAGTLPAEEEV